jgi:hypothetical protein
MTFPYREVADRMRQLNPPPTDDMFVTDYYASSAIYAVVDALESLGSEQ